MDILLIVIYLIFNRFIKYLKSYTIVLNCINLVLIPLKIIITILLSIKIRNIEVKVIISLNKKVLAAFSSKFGYIEEIVNKISNILNGEGLQVDLLNLEKTSKKKWPSIDE